MTRFFRYVILLLSVLTTGLIFSSPLAACTSLLVTKGASADGSVMITYTADSAGFYPILELLPATDHPADAVIEIPATKERVAASIKQVSHTYKVLGVSWDGNHLHRQGTMNEFQLAITETTFGGRKELHNPQGLLSYSLLMTLALQRAKTAQEAIDVMVRLIEEYGYGDEGESISIADKNEAWVFEIIGTGPSNEVGKGGAIWVAKKVPDGEISVHANQARIGEIIENDPENFRYSANVKTFAVEKGWYNPNDNRPFRFCEVYDEITVKSRRVCAGRVWSILRRAAPSLNLSPDHFRGVEGVPDYPWSIKPDRKLSAADVMVLKRDHFEGTDFDMTKGLDAGPYGLPRRWRPLYWKVDGVEYAWERPISTQQTGYSVITQSRAHLPDAIGGLVWYGVDDSALNCHFPLYVTMTELPQAFCCGSITRYTPDSAWWTFNIVANYANLKYSMMSKEIIAVQQELETKFMAFQEPIEKAALDLHRKDPKLASTFLTDYSVKQGEKVVARWRELMVEVFTKYNDGYVRSEEGKYPDVGYPEEWLREVNKAHPEKFKVSEP